MHLPVQEVHVLEVVLNLRLVLVHVLELDAALSVTGVLKDVTCPRDDVLGLLEDVIEFQDVFPRF